MALIQHCFLKLKYLRKYCFYSNELHKKKMAWERCGRRKQEFLLGFLVRFNELLSNVDKKINGENSGVLEDMFINMRNSLQVKFSSLYMCQWLTLWRFSAQIRAASWGLGDNSRFFGKFIIRTVQHGGTNKQIICIIKISFYCGHLTFLLCFCSLDPLISFFQNDFFYL